MKHADIEVLVDWGNPAHYLVGLLSCIVIAVFIIMSPSRAVVQGRVVKPGELEEDEFPGDFTDVVYDTRCCCIRWGVKSTRYKQE